MSRPTARKKQIQQKMKMKRNSKKEFRNILRWRISKTKVGIFQVQMDLNLKQIHISDIN